MLLVYCITISLTLTKPEPYANALLVAVIGIMKAAEHDKAMGNIKYNGLYPNDMDCIKQNGQTHLLIKQCTQLETSQCQYLYLAIVLTILDATGRSSLAACTILDNSVRNPA